MASAIEVITLVLGYLETNTYIAHTAEKKEAVIIDPAWDAPAIIKTIEKNKLTPTAILLTHGHADHIGAVTDLKNKYKIKVYIHEEDAAMLTSADLNLSYSLGFGVTSGMPDIILKDGEVIKSAGMEFKVIHTPGHTPGGVAFYSEGIAFTGDTLFFQSIGRSDLPGSSESRLFESLKKLMELPGNTEVYPGHGPKSTIKFEKNNNPYISGD